MADYPRDARGLIDAAAAARMDSEARRRHALAMATDRPMAVDTSVLRALASRLQNIGVMKDIVAAAGEIDQLRKALVDMLTMLEGEYDGAKMASVCNAARSALRRP